MLLEPMLVLPFFQLFFTLIFSMFPVLFHIYGFEIHTYPVFVLLGVLLSSWYIIRLCSQNRLMLQFINDNLFTFSFGVFAFSRIGGILESWSTYSQNPLLIFNIFDASYNFYAGVLGFILMVFLAAFRKKEAFWKWLDVLSRSFLLFFIILSLADFSAGKNYGIPTELPWAVSVSIPEVRYTIPVHPVQIYEFLLLTALFAFLTLKSRKKQYEGVITSYAFFGFFSIQAFIILFQGAPDFVIFGMKFGLLASLFAAGVFLVMLIIHTHPNKHWFHHDH